MQTPKGDELDMTVPVDLEVWKAVPGFGSYHDTHVRGSRSALSKLTPEQADEIRAADPRSLRKLAARIGVSHACVWDVHRGITYKPDPTPEEIARIKALLVPTIAEVSNG